MPRNRIFYQSEGLFIGPTGALGSASLTGIQRVQSISHNANVNRTNVLQVGKLAQIDRVILESPSTVLNFECLLVNAVNANRLGFVTDGSVSCIAKIISGTRDVNNYYVAIAPEGSDLVGTTGAGCFGFGNGFISNATFAAAVGQFPTESYTVEALNYRIYTISSGNVPSVDQKTGLEPGTNTFVIPTATTGTATSATALLPGDITLSLNDTIGFSSAGLHIQNFNLSVPLTREGINQFGTRFAYAKIITFPITVKGTFTAIAGDIANGGLADKLCSDAPVDLSITLKEPNCSGLGTTAIKFDLLGAKMDNTNYTSNIGSNSTVTFEYSSLLGGPEDTSFGLFISGISS